MRPPNPRTEPEPDDAEEVIADMITACQMEIVDPAHCETTPYETSEPGW